MLSPFTGAARRACEGRGGGKPRTRLASPSGPIAAMKSASARREGPFGATRGSGMIHIGLSRIGKLVARRQRTKTIGRLAMTARSAGLALIDER
jgi:hypothetical protein